MDLKNKENLADYIQNEINKYKKSESKTAECKEDLIHKATLYPSELWAIHAPTNQLAHEFRIIEAKADAQLWLSRYRNKTDTLQTVVEICYQSCLIRDGKNENKLDQTMLTQWENVFTAPEFLERLTKEILKWKEWNNKSVQEKLESVEASVNAMTSSVIKNKP